jgi:hypothetical protein
LNNGTKIAVIVGGGLLLAIIARELVKGVIAAAPTVGKALNPLSSDNLAYSGATAATQYVTGDPYTTFGAKLFEALHPATVAAEKAALADSAPYNATDDEDAAMGLYMEQLAAENSGAANSLQLKFKTSRTY